MVDNEFENRPDFIIYKIKTLKSMRTALTSEGL